MADYRDEFRSALTQLEALRAENAALRARLRQHESPQRSAGVADDTSSAASPPPTPAEPPQRARVRLGAAIVVTTVAGLLAAARVSSPREERLLLPNLPEVPVAAGPTAPLPLPATTVRLPDRDAARVTEVLGPPLRTAPVAIDNLRTPSLRWPADRDVGLYVLHTAEPAHCSVGGVMFDSPGAVFVSAGEHPVRCLLGRTRHIWVIPIEARRVTFDTQHPLRSP